MKLLFTDYHMTLPLAENCVHRLCIESPQAYADIVQSLYAQCSGGEGGVILSDGAQSLALAKVAEILLEPFSLTFDTRKITTQLHKELADIAMEECYPEYLTVQSGLQTFTETVTLKLLYPIAYEEVIELKDLWKLLKVRIDTGYDTLAEKLCDYVKLLSQLCATRLLFLVDMEKYLTSDDQQTLQETANYHKIILIYIDAGLGHFSETDRTCILDHDYCVISNTEQ